MLREANLTSRALIVALGVCLAAPVGVAAQTTAEPNAQTTLPPPPYAASGGFTQARYPTAHTAPIYDRYGGGSAHAPQARAPLGGGVATSARTAVAYTGPRLGWNGKTAGAPTQVGPTPWRAAHVNAAYPSYVPASSGRLQYPSMAMAAPAAAPAPVSAPEAYAPPVYTPPVGRPASPTSIYDPAPALPPLALSAPPVRTATAAPGEGPRLYSLHRDYGMEPDPIPLAPQFFGPTADLSAPETPEVGHRTKTSTGAVMNAPTDAAGGQ